jgi:hypothetical protein
MYLDVAIEDLDAAIAEEVDLGTLSVVFVLASEGFGAVFFH